MKSITYQRGLADGSVLDNTHEVIDFIGGQPDCPKCHGTGEYEGEFGPIGCNPCNSRLIAVETSDGIDYADWGDTIIQKDDGSFTILHKKGD